MLSQPSSGLAAPTPANLSERLNAVQFKSTQIAAALEVLATLHRDHRRDLEAQATALHAYARDAGFADDALAGAALHARVAALKKWAEAHDPLRQSDAQAVVEAAARQPLVQTAAGLDFEAPAFQELILFIEELPW
jgi:hypothetical protein